MDRQEVLERTTEKNGSARVENREISAQEQLHRDKMPEYRKALYSDDFVTELASAEKQSADPAVRTAPVNAQRFADYTPYAPPASKKVLFEDVITKDVETTAPAAATVSAPAAPAPAYAPKPVAVPEKAAAPSEEDALPTRRTMNTLHRSTVEAATQTSTGFFAALSTRTKVALAAIAFAIVLAIVVICINTGIINAKDANIQALREQVLQKQQTYEEIMNQIEDIENFEGSIVEIVTDYAEEHGMIRK